MEALWNLTNVNSLSNVKALLQLNDKVESHVRSLKSLGVDSSSYSNLMISILNKLPQELRIIITKALGDEWTLDKMLNTFKKELEARERASLMSPKPSEDQRTNERTLRFKGNNTATSLISGNGSPPTFTFCTQSHPSANCSTVTNTAASKEILKKEGRCYICFCKNHISRGCTSNLKCYHCGKQRHASICSSKDELHVKGKHSETTKSSDQRKEQQQRETNKKGDNKVPTQEKCHAYYINAETSILLQTVQADAYSASTPEKSSE